MFTDKESNELQTGTISKQNSQIYYLNLERVKMK